MTLAGAGAADSDACGGQASHVTEARRMGGEWGGLGRLWQVPCGPADQCPDGGGSSVARASSLPEETCFDANSLYVGN